MNLFKELYYEVRELSETLGPPDKENEVDPVKVTEIIERVDSLLHRANSLLKLDGP